MRDCEQLAALELKRADSAREENSQLRWDLQEAQQALAQRSNDYEVRHIRTYVCTYIRQCHATLHAINARMDAVIHVYVLCILWYK